METEQGQEPEDAQGGASKAGKLKSKAVGTTKLARDVAAGAAGGGGLPGAAAVLAKKAAQTKTARRIGIAVAAALAVVLAPLAALMFGFGGSNGYTGSVSNQQEKVVEQAVAGGLTDEEIVVLQSEGAGRGVSWIVLAAMYAMAKNGSGGTGIYHVTDEALSDTFTAEDAADFPKATAWAAQELADNARKQDRFSSATDIGLGGELRGGELTWIDADASEQMVRNPYGNAIAGMRIEGASRSTGDQIVDIAIHWRFGLAAGPTVCNSTYTGALPENLSFEITPEQMGNAVTIVNTGKSVGVPEQGWVVALMTALQESTLRNLTYGDADSLGLFQQRPSTGWGTPEEILDPVKSSQAFYGEADHTSNPGLMDIPGWESMPLGQAAQEVQRSAFPEAYAKWEPDARLLVAQITGTVPAGGRTAKPVARAGESMAFEWIPIRHYDIGPVKPMTQKLADEVGSKFEIETIYGWRESDPYPDHPEGRAADFMVMTDRAKGDALAAYAQEHAAEYGIEYMIWYQRIWHAGEPVGTWTPMDDRGGTTANHKDHVHITISEDAAGETMPATGCCSVGSGCKPFLSGLLARTDISTGTYARVEDVTGFVIQLDWDQLEAVQGTYTFDKIQHAADWASENGKRFRLRIREGIHAPGWAKDLSAHGKPLPRFYDHDEHRNSDLPYLYDPDYIAAHQALMRALSAQFDVNPALGEVNITGNGAMTAEWMLLFGGEMTDNGKTNLANMLAAGFTEEQRQAAVEQDIAFMLSAWPTTPLTSWSHPYQSLGGASRSTNDWIDYQAGLSGGSMGRIAFGHTGLNQAATEGRGGAASIYAHIEAGNLPFTLQTRSMDGGHGEDPLGDFAVIFPWAVEHGVMAIELPNGWQSANPSPEMMSETNAGMAANAAAHSGAGPVPAGEWIIPLPAGSYTITSWFGPRPYPGAGGSTDHGGIDMAAVMGTPISAAASGTVTFAGDCGCGYGNLVSIDTGGGLVMYYGHMSVVSTTTGATVTTGTGIGLVGSTGHSTGPHLHFEFRQDGTRVDPVPLLAAKGLTL